MTEAKAKAKECGCGDVYDCHNAQCHYPEPHQHSFACDSTCTVCGGGGSRVKDPENHPDHEQWTQPCTCEEGFGRCKLHHNPRDILSLRDAVIRSHRIEAELHHKLAPNHLGHYPNVSAKALLEILEAE